MAYINDSFVQSADWIVAYINDSLLQSADWIVAYIIDSLLQSADWILADGGRVGLLASNREGIYSVLGYLAIYLAGVSWAAEIFTENFNFML